MSDAHTSSFETGRLKSEAGNGDQARSKEGLTITSTCVHMKMSMHVRAAV